LGIDGTRQTPTHAADVVEFVCGPWGGRAISVLVMLSALGAINGMILTGTRIYATWGADYPALAWLGTWNRQLAAPLAAIAVQAAVAVLLIVLVGTATGRNLCDGALRSIGIAGLPWDKYFGGFETLVAGSAPVFWAFFLLTSGALFVLRAQDPSQKRPFSVPFYPLPPLVFCATCMYMLYSSLEYAGWLALLGAAPLALGGALLAVVRRGEKS
jgi:amino acid transporter